MGTNSEKNELDELVVNTELTLISLIQGIALFFLAEAAVESFKARRLEDAPYVVAGLFIILVFWSRSLIHTFTVIRWPLEFEHNFLYIGCALLESLLFAQTEDHRSWWALYVVFLAVCWYLFYSDLKMIRARMRMDPSGPALSLYRKLLRDQLLQIRVVVPMFLALGGVGTALLWTSEGDRQKAISTVVGVLALCLNFAYLLITTRFFAEMAPLLSRARGIRRPPKKRRALRS
jgi:hypothetical protein